MADEQPQSSNSSGSATSQSNVVSSESDARTVVPDTKSQSGSHGGPTADVIGVGTKLGPYELVRKLGQGGMGAVYEARHQKLGKTFALKVLPGGFASNRAALTRFEREMQAIGKLDHPHIIKATDADEWQGTHYLVMEYVEGADLSELVKARGPLSVRDASKAIRQAAMGLEHAHQHGLVHRDIKPSNLFVTKSGQIKLLDLGLARLGDDGEHQRGLTTVGQVLGTPDYMAPEQWDDTHSVDARADLYSLGCTLFFVLTGRAPYADVTKSSLLQLMKAHVEGAIPNLTDIRLDVPAELNAVFVRLLAKNADDRYANAGEVIAALEPFTRKGSDTEGLTGKPVFVPGKEPPAAHAAVSTPQGSKVREGDRSAQRSIKSLSASSTDDAFGSNRPMIQSDRSASMVETIIQSRPQHPSRGRGTLLIGISLVSIAALIGLAIHFTSKPATDSAGRETSTAGQLSGDNKNEIQTPTGWHGWPADAPKPAIAPFDADQAKKHQEEWAAYLKVPVEYTNSIGMKFRLIPPGEYLLGYTSDQAERLIPTIPEEWLKGQITAASARKVVIEDVFYQSITEVTVNQFRQFVTAKNYKTTAEQSGLGATRWDALKGEIINDPNLTWASSYPQPYDERLPVDCITGQDIQSFCVWLSELDNLHYQMPTEEQWEYTCRAGTTSLWWAGDDETKVLAAEVFDTRSPMPVGSRTANPFGLFDIQANIKEWARKPSGDLVKCGGTFGTPLRWGYSATRSGTFNSLSSASGVGFRVAIAGQTGPDDRNHLNRAPRPKGRSEPDKPWHGWPADAPKPAIAPFDADQAKKHQEEWAAYLKVPVEYTNSIGMKFRLIPPGEFTMGSTSAEIEEALMFTGEVSHWKSCIQSEAPQHTVTLTRPIYLGVHEVTQEAYKKVMDRNPSHFSAMGAGNGSVSGIDTSRHPVELVSWIDAAEFCTKLSTQENFRPFYSDSGDAVTQPEGNGYRLPTEAEWEFACRAGSTTTFWSGNNSQQLASCGWFGSNSQGRTHAVGELNANPMGLYDIHGNVFEWVQDWWDPAYYSQLKEKPAQNPDGATLSAHRSVRGGGWDHPASRCRSALRLASDPPYREHNLGFRVALTLDAVRTKTAEGK